MTGDEIIKALEYCATDDGDDCFQCPYGNIVYKQGNGGCANRCRKDALDLIKRQKAELERLEIELQAMRNAANGYKAKIERLEKENNSKIVMCIANDMEKAKSKAIKEFAVRLKESKIKPEYPWDDYYINEGTIDALVKEMTEE